ncbi:MAG: EAL domain-containing protein [Anaerolineaceae bacterium]|nr:EAL domain-containing protein [Anaerolineaceae bacterium]
MNESKEKKTIWYWFRRALGFYSNPPYVENQLREADVRGALFLTGVVTIVEIWMLLRYVKNWVLPGEVETLGEFFHYTKDYWFLLIASLLLFTYSSLYLRGKASRLKKFSGAFIFLYYLFAMYFGITTAQHDFSRGRMIICFLTFLMYATIICIWRPYTSILLVCAFGFGFLWLLNNRTFDKAGNALHLSEGDTINYITFMLVLFILSISVYYQRYRDASKSWKLEQIAVTDDLTGMPNIRKFEEEAKEYLYERFSVGEHPIYLVLDIANFQTYNDRFGYSGGDQLLIHMGKILRSAFPDEPVVRVSGDNFAVLTNAEDYKERVANIRRQLKAAYPTETYLDIKVGSYRAKGNTKNARHAIDRAHHALKYLHNSDNEFIIEYDEKMRKDHKLKEYVLNNLEKAVNEGYIKVYYQPVMWSEDGAIAGCEALARWIDPEIGFLSPGLFIPTLEDARQIHKLDLCIYESVFKNIRECMDQGLQILPVSMNFSRLDFELMDVVKELKSLMDKYQIPKEYLHVEVTESALTSDVSGMKKALKELSDDGFEIWLDDFGSGYSSFNVLKDFHFDLLKIDMEFLRNFSKDNENAKRIISTIIDLAEKLHMGTVAEGVETLDAVDFLREAGCGRLQGYYYGKPMPFEELRSKIDNGDYRVRS